MTKKNSHIWLRRISLSVFFIGLIIFCYLLYNMPTYQSNLEGMVAYNNNFKRLIFFGAVSFFSLYIYITSRLKNFKKINSGEGDHPQKEIFIEDKKGYTVKKLLLKSFLAFLVGFIASYWYKKSWPIFYYNLPST